MARRLNQTLTITSGTPINLATGKTTAAPGPVYATRYFIQMQHGGSGIGKVYDGVPASMANPTFANYLTAELAAATSQAPGGSFEDWDKSGDRGGIDVNEVWIDGGNTNDTVLTSYVPKG